MACVREPVEALSMQASALCALHRGPPLLGPSMDLTRIAKKVLLNSQSNDTLPKRTLK